jgi:hypothetical protein
MRTPVSWIEKVVGVFVLIVIGVVIAAGALKAKSSGLFGEDEDHVLYAWIDGAHGLSKGSSVVFADTDVGTVSDLQLLGPGEAPKGKKEGLAPQPDPAHFVLVEMRVKGEYSKFLFEGVTASLNKQLVGGAKLELKTPTLTAEVVARPKIPNPSMIDLKAPRSAVDDVMENAPELVASVKRTLAEVEVLMGNLREASSTVPEIARKADDAVGDVDRTIEGVQKLPLLNSRVPPKPRVESEHEAVPRGAQP